MPSQLDGRVAVVTGAAQGLGRQYAIELADRGAAVSLLDIDREFGAQSAKQINRDGGNAMFIPCDVAIRVEVEAAVSQTIDRFDRLDILVSNAGTIHADTGLADTDDDDWWRTLHVHLGGALNLSRASLPYLRESPAPRIILISSMWALRGPGFGHAYAAAKGALIGFARNLAIELGPDGICVNAVAPGSVPTRMAADWGPTEIAEDSKSIPLARWGTHEELAAVVAFLASDDSAYLHGQTISVNGGQLFS